MGLVSLTAGIVQSVTGFGAGIVIMLFLPLYLPMNVAPAISNGASFPLAWAILFRYRREANYRLALVPIIVYLAISTIAIKISATINLDYLQIVFGFLLIALSGYYLLFSGKIVLKQSLRTACLCGILSGLMGGFFGIGGPPLAIYFLSTTKSKEEYLGTINFLFSVTSTYQFLARIGVGLFTGAQVPLLLCCIAMILVGRFAGSRIVDRINGEQLKKCVYGFLGIAGVTTIIGCL